jgi:hypothetical protein
MQAEQVALMVHIRNGHRILVVIPDGKRYLGVPRSRRVDVKNIALDYYRLHITCSLSDACEHSKVLSGTTDF